MAVAKEFEEELDKLFRQRTQRLRSILRMASPGKAPNFGRKNVDHSIERLQSLASQALAHRLAKWEFNIHAPKKQWWFVKGRGPKEKRQNFNEWYNRTFPRESTCIYAFWAGGNKCIWVGKTIKGRSRPGDHFEKHWFSQVRRITIRPVRNKGQVPKLECLAIHHFRPSKNTNLAAAGRWTKKCPLCDIHKAIKSELRKIFRLK